MFRIVHSADTIQNVDRSGIQYFHPDNNMYYTDISVCTDNRDMCTIRDLYNISMVGVYRVYDDNIF